MLVDCPDSFVLLPPELYKMFSDYQNDQRDEPNFMKRFNIASGKLKSFLGQKTLSHS